MEVAESRLDSREELHAYRRTLWGWLIAAGAGLLLSQALLQHWGLRPLRRLVRELRDVRQGRRAQLDSAAPAELLPLADGVNRLLQAEREKLEKADTFMHEVGQQSLALAAKAAPNDEQRKAFEAEQKQHETNLLKLSGLD